MIIVNKEYRISGYNSGWAVEKYKDKRFDKITGEPSELWECQTYHARVSGAIESVLNLRLKDLPDMEIREFLKEAKRMKEELQEAFSIAENSTSKEKHNV